MVLEMGNLEDRLYATDRLAGEGNVKTCLNVEKIGMKTRRLPSRCYSFTTPAMQKHTSLNAESNAHLSRRQSRHMVGLPTSFLGSSSSTFSGVLLRVVSLSRVFVLLLLLRNAPQLMLLRSCFVSLIP
jgi:hypothetical protein